MLKLGQESPMSAGDASLNSQMSKFSIFIAFAFIVEKSLETTIICLPNRTNTGLF